MRIVRLDDVCEFKPKKAQVKQLLNGKALVSFAPMETLPTNQKYFTSKEEKTLDSVYSSYTYFEENDVVYAKITPCFQNGKLSIAKNLKNGIGFGSSEFVPIRCSDEILPEYLYYFLMNPSFIKNGIPMMVGASGHRRVPNVYTESLEIALPSVEEQQRIVARLDAAFEKISAAEVLMRQNLDNVAALQKSILHKYLSASGSTYTHRLSAFFDVRDGTHDSPSYHTTGYPLVTSKNLKTGTLSMDKIKYISKSDYEKINERSKVDIGDVLMAMIGTIGNPILIEQEPEFAIKNVALFKPVNGNNGKFLKYYLQSEAVSNKMQKDAKGTTQRFVSLGYLRELPFPDIQPEQQRVIVEKIDLAITNTEKLRINFEKKLEKIKQLRQSLLQQAFSTTNTV